MTEVILGEIYPATTPQPLAATPGMVVHGVYDISMYRGTPVFNAYIVAYTDVSRMIALRSMPNATVRFTESREGKSIFPPAIDFDIDLLDQ